MNNSMNNETYKVQEILSKVNKFNNSNINIKSKTIEFSIKLSKENIPHLLGLHYMEKKEDKVPAYRKINYIFNENISDQDILNKVKQNSGFSQMKRVENRINSFEDFMNNLEKGIIVEKTLKKGNMAVNYLVVQSKNDDFYHLGILAGNNGAILEEFNESNEIEKSFFRTYFIEDNIDYFVETKIMEEITSISKYNEDLEEYIPFSFDEDKNKALIEEYKINKDFNYKEFLKENFDDKEQIKSWNTKNKSHDDD